MTINDEKRRAAKSPYTQALDLLTRLLAMRDHSRHELRTKLSRRFESELVERVLSEAEEHGWLGNEDEIAARVVEALERKHKSRPYIEEQLRKRRLPVPPSEGEREIEKIRSLIERRFGAAAKMSYEDRAKAYRFLKYRGFEDRWIRMALF